MRRRLTKRLAGALWILCLGLAVPTAQAAVDLKGWDIAPLADDWRMKQVLGGVARTRDGEKIGVVADAVIDSTGLLNAVVVKTADGSFFEAPWTAVDFDPSMQAVTLGITAEALGGVEKVSSVEAFRDATEVRARDLIGMPLRFEDSTRDWGRVRDLLVTPGVNELSAFVVRRKDETERLYAVPWDIESVRRGKRVIEVPYPERAGADLDPFGY